MSCTTTDPLRARYNAAERRKWALKGKETSADVRDRRTVSVNHLAHIWSENISVLDLVFESDAYVIRKNHFQARYFSGGECIKVRYLMDGERLVKLGQDNVKKELVHVWDNFASASFFFLLLALASGPSAWTCS